MFPELFSVGSFTVYSYGLMTALGIFSVLRFLSLHEDEMEDLF